MTNFYVNGADQGDGICVRMNPDWDTWSFPIKDLASSDMACGNYYRFMILRNTIDTLVGFGGTTGVGRTCEVKDGATVTLEWRQNANQPGAGVIPIGHRGPCAVYMKKVGTAMTDTATGDGWFKLWDKGYTDDWCTMSLIASKGEMTFTIPTGI